MAHAAGKAVGVSRRVEPDRQRAVGLNRRALIASNPAGKSKAVGPWPFSRRWKALGVVAKSLNWRTYPSAPAIPLGDYVSASRLARPTGGGWPEIGVRRGSGGPIDTGRGLCGSISEVPSGRLGWPAPSLLSNILLNRR